MASPATSDEEKSVHRQSAQSLTRWAIRRCSATTSSTRSALVEPDGRQPRQRSVLRPTVPRDQGLHLCAGCDDRGRDRRVQYRAARRDPRDRRQQILPDHDEPDAGARQHQIGLGGSLPFMSRSERGRGGGQWNFTGQASGLGLATCCWAGSPLSINRALRRGYYQWYQGLYARTMESDERITVQRRPRWEPSQPESDARRQHDLRRDCPADTSGAPCSATRRPGSSTGDAGFPPGTSGLEQKWTTCPRASASAGTGTATAACRPIVVRAHVRLYRG